MSRKLLLVGDDNEVTYKLFEGDSTSVTITEEENDTLDIKKPVYLEYIRGNLQRGYNASYKDDQTPMYTVNKLGERIAKDVYRYTITATSADGSVVKQTMFKLPYQLIYTSGSDYTAVYTNLIWNDELNCYDVILNALYYYFDDLSDLTPHTFSENLIASWYLRTDNGYAPSSGSMEFIDGNWLSVNYNNVSGSLSDKCYITNSLLRDGYIGIMLTNSDRSEGEMNEFFATYGPVEVYLPRNEELVIHTEITKKIKLPNLGPGTVYKVGYDRLNSKLNVSAPFKIE